MKLIKGQKRWARSYSIVDHHLIHGGYLKRLSHQAMALYLFLVVVGDAEGKSFYSDISISNILRMDGKKLIQAKNELIKFALIDYRRPYWWVLSLVPRQINKTSQDGEIKRQAQRSAKSSDLISVNDILSNSNSSHHSTQRNIYD